jgi:dGTPase
VKLRYVTEDDAAAYLAFAKGARAKMPVSQLRAYAIGTLVNECAAEFVGHVGPILDGTHRRALTDTIPSADALDEVQKFTRKRCYRAADVLEIELAGYEAIAGLLGHFVDAVVVDEKSRTKRQKTALSLLEARRVPIDETLSRYERILRVTDYVSGMTDRYALATYRRISGGALPGRLA